MITAEYVREQLEKVQTGDATPAKARDFALLSIAQKYLSKDTPKVAAYQFPVLDAPAKTSGETVSVQGDSDFLKAVSGKDAAAVMAVMDGHMSALQQMNPRAYNAIMRRIKEI